MQRFRELKDPKKLNVKPDRIRIRATRSGGTLRQALKGLGVPKDKMKEVALLNGRRLNEPIQKNTLLKTISKQR
jgi:predicted Zn-dependent protease